jgi:chaperone required for assembly of F1-ATPase
VASAYGPAWFEQFWIGKTLMQNKKSERREFLESAPKDTAAEAAQRAVRPALRRRVYKAVTLGANARGHLVNLDGKPARTPGGRPLGVPVVGIARALADEWAAQGEQIDPAKMPLTRLANTIIDRVAASRPEVAAEIRKYAAGDLLFYRAEAPAALRARQAQHWDPVLAWARDALDAEFKVVAGVTHVQQPEAALQAAAAALPRDEWRLGALHVATTLTGSALLALALMRGAISAETAWLAAHVDEDWNMEQWGRDEIALQRRGFRFTEFSAAALVLRALAD